MSFVKNIDKLPTLSLIAHEILRFAEDDRISIDSITEIDAKDPAITEKILNVANSADGTSLLNIKSYFLFRKELRNL